MATHVITVYATHSKPKPLTIRDDEGHFANTAEDDAKLMRSKEDEKIAMFHMEH